MDTEQLLQQVTAIAEMANKLLDDVSTRKYEEVGLDLSEYRDDGFSVETSDLGARRHIAVDRAVKILESSSEKFAEQVLDSADVWFAFRPDEYPDLAPETDEKVREVWNVRNSYWGATLRHGRRDFAVPWRVRLADPDRINSRVWEVIDGHTFVFLRRTNDPKAWVERYAQDMIDRPAILQQQEQERLRREREGIVLPGASPG